MASLRDWVIEEQERQERDDALLFTEWQYGRLYPDEALALDFGADFDPSELEDGETSAAGAFTEREGA